MSWKTQNFTLNQHGFVDSRDEVNSTKHYLLHRPALPQHCEDCMRAKTKRKKGFAKLYRECTGEYGVRVTCDHIHMKDSKNKNQNAGTDGHVQILSFLCKETRLRQAVPVKTISETATTNALRFLKGNDDWGILYGDNFGGYESAAYANNCAYQFSQPGVHHSNSLIENTNLQMEYDIKVCLLLAGLPACFWPYAAPYVCLMHNTTYGNDATERPWNIKHGDDFH